MFFFSGKVSHPFQFDNSSSTLDHFYANLTTLFIAFADIKDFAVFFILDQQILRANIVHIQHINKKSKQTRKDFKSPFPAENLKFREV